MIKRLIIAATSLAALSACSGGKEKASDDKAAAAAAAARTAAIARSHVKVTPSVPDTVKGEDRARLQATMIEAMADSPDVSPEEYEGEAYRRNVKLTPDQMARKKAAYKPQKPADATPAAKDAPQPGK